MYSNYPYERPGVNWGRFAIGATVAVIAILISLGTYQSASVGGGHYVVLWGAALWGGWRALTALGGR